VVKLGLGKTALEDFVSIDMDPGCAEFGGVGKGMGGKSRDPVFRMLISY
jgi:hypothetical protein